MTPHPEYRWVEIAVGGPHRRGRVVEVDTLRRHIPRGAVDAYRSIYRFHDALPEWVRTHRNEWGKPTTKGFRGSCWFDYWWADIDREDLAVALDDARTLLHALEARYDLDLRTVRAYYSGNRGFHLGVHWRTFGEALEPGEHIPATCRELALAMIDGRIEIDESIYDTTRLLRVSNTRHGKTGRYKVPLAITEILHADLDAILALAARPRPETEAGWVEPETPNPALAELYAECRRTTASRPAGGDALDPAEIVAILRTDATPGNRHPSLVRLAGHLLAVGVDPAVATELLIAWNRLRCSPPKPDQEIVEIVRGLSGAERERHPERAAGNAFVRWAEAAGISTDLARRIARRIRNTRTAQVVTHRG